MEEIIKQAIKVRELQREYFHGRDIHILRACKAAEATLDKMLYDYTNLVGPEGHKVDIHPKLF